jgi:hypothetical protein
MLQNGEGIRGPAVAQSGGTIEVEVGPNDTTVEVSTGNAAETTSHDVTPGKTASIPVPTLPGGGVIWITVGKGVRRRTIIVEVVELSS